MKTERSTKEKIDAAFKSLMEMPKDQFEKKLKESKGGDIAQCLMELWSVQWNPVSNEFEEIKVDFLEE